MKFLSMSNQFRQLLDKLRQPYLARGDGMNYEIRNKFIEAAHPSNSGECTVRKMTEEEWQKYGPPQRIKKRRGASLNCGWGHKMAARKGKRV